MVLFENDPEPARVQRYVEGELVLHLFCRRLSRVHLTHDYLFQGTTGCTGRGRVRGAGVQSAGRLLLSLVLRLGQHNNLPLGEGPHRNWT